MSMLRNNLQESAGYSAVAKAERCKPDYETMIFAAKKKSDECQSLLDAIMDFNDGNGNFDGKMNELVGEIYTMADVIKRRIQSLIKEQEARQD